ncbi:MAG: hypothetical protein MI923_27740 [Phycisphaerales bacterium]|nr:hypothetical protein [Phycisphaerales bacterium]
MSPLTLDVLIGRVSIAAASVLHGLSLEESDHECALKLKAEFEQRLRRAKHVDRVPVELVADAKERHLIEQSLASISAPDTCRSDSSTYSTLIAALDKLCQGTLSADGAESLIIGLRQVTGLSIEEP